MQKAVILFSGGLDSTTVLALAQSQGFACYALSVDYGQRHRAELNAAKHLARYYKVIEHKIINIDLRPIGGSALTDSTQPIHPFEISKHIPNTYVPARNTLFLSIALGWAEVLEASHIFIGANSVDYSNYPDCRPEFIKAFENLSHVATKPRSLEAQFKICAPLIDASKAEIIALGTSLKVPYQDTVSCYQSTEEGNACGYCDSCGLRKQAFIDAKIADPTRYHILSPS